VKRRLGAVWQQAAAVALQLGRQRRGDGALVAGHERLEAVAGDVGRVVLVAGCDLRVKHVGALEELGVRRAGISDVTVTPVSFSSLRSASAKDCTNDFDAL
jgi:hypothetical protein